MNFFNTTKTGYRYDKRIFWGVMGVLILIFLYFGFNTNWNLTHNIYFECNGLKACENPWLSYECDREWLYGEGCLVECTEEWCSLEELPPGIYGEKPPEFYDNFGLIAFLSFLFIIIFNHLIHNRGKAFDFEIKITKNKVLSLQSLIKNIEKANEDKDNGLD